VTSVTINNYKWCSSNTNYK